jgi:hypothetical protein
MPAWRCLHRGSDPLAASGQHHGPSIRSPLGRHISLNQIQGERESGWQRARGFLEVLDRSLPVGVGVSLVVDHNIDDDGDDYDENDDDWD